ncbi:MAG: hypothetical protein ACI33J_09665 [Clostridium sp.]
MKLYLLEHNRKINGYDELKTLGIYSSEEEAKKVILEYKKLPGFKDYLDEFRITEYKIDKKYCIEGFEIPMNIKENKNTELK